MSWSNALFYGIGIDNYQHLRKLNYCANDAMAVAEAFAQKISNITSSTIAGYSTNTTTIEIAQVLKEIQNKRLDDEDLLIFYFSGHGCSVGGVDYLACSDTNPKEISDTAINTSCIIDAIAETKVGTSILIFDSCREEVGKSIDVSQFGRYTSELARRRGTIVFFSCSPEELSYENPKLEHGLFTYSLIAAINQEKVHTTINLDQSIVRRVSELCKTNNYPSQRPYTVVAPLQKAALDIFTGKVIIENDHERRTCIILAGPSNSGKTSLGQYIASRYGFLHVEMSSFAYKRFQNKPDDFNGNMQEFMEEIVWQENDKAIIAEDLINSNLTNQNMVICGPRATEEIETLFAQRWNIIPVYLYANASIRYKRHFGGDKEQTRFNLSYKEFIVKDMKEYDWGLAKMATIDSFKFNFNEYELKAAFSTFDKLAEKHHLTPVDTKDF